MHGKHCNGEVHAGCGSLAEAHLDIHIMNLRIPCMLGRIYVLLNVVFEVLYSVDVVLFAYTYVCFDTFGRGTWEVRTEVQTARPRIQL